MPRRRPAIGIRSTQEFAVGAGGWTGLVPAGAVAWMLAIGFSLLVGGSAVAKQTPTKAAVVSQRVAVQTGQFETVTDTCSSSYPHPVGPFFGYVKGASTPGSVALTASYPRERRGWLIAIENLTNKAQTVDFGIVCVRSDARFAYPRERNTVAGGSGYSTGLSDCPRSAPHPIDNYFGVQTAADAGSLLLTAAYPFSTSKAAGFLTGVRSSASGSLLFFAGSVCTSLRTATRYGREKVAAGKSNGATIRCPAATSIPVSGWFYPLPPRPTSPNDGKIAMDFTFPAARNKWAVGVTSLTDHAVKYVLGTECLG